MSQPTMEITEGGWRCRNCGRKLRTVRGMLKHASECKEK